MTDIKPISVELEYVSPVDKILGRDRWDCNRGFQKSSLEEALKRAHATQKSEDPEDSNQ